MFIALSTTEWSAPKERHVVPLKHHAPLERKEVWQGAINIWLRRSPDRYAALASRAGA